jgi:hypothetical protein
MRQATDQQQETDIMTNETRQPTTTLAPLTGFSYGQALTSEYRAVLTQRNGKPVIAVEQEIDGNWHRTPGQWYLHTLTARYVKSDRIAIDCGQEWFVEGINAAIAKAEGGN